VNGRHYGRGFWIALTIGGTVMLYGAFGLVEDAGLAHAREVAWWLIGLNLAHDLVVAPLVCVAGVVVARALRPPWRAPVQSGLLTSAVVLAVGWMNLRGYGRSRTNPTKLPLDYGTGVVTALAIVWAATALWLLVALFAARRRRTAPRRGQAVATDRAGGLAS
jgi:hypothetical protein